MIAQETLDYVPNLELLKPEYVVHGDDWQKGVQAKTRQRVIDCLAQWGGKLIEVPYTSGVSSTSLIAGQREVGTTPNLRLGNLRRLMETNQGDIYVRTVTKNYRFFSIIWHDAV